jgi:hypothetical protein
MSFTPRTLSSWSDHDYSDESVELTEGDKIIMYATRYGDFDYIDRILNRGHVPNVNLLSLKMTMKHWNEFSKFLKLRNYKGNNNGSTNK